MSIKIDATQELLRSEPVRWLSDLSSVPGSRVI